MLRDWPTCCLDCGLFRACKNPAINGKGNKAAKVLCLFEAPGKDEDELNEILMGPAGKRLESILDTLYTKHGIDLGLTSSRWENVVMCQPKEDKTPKINHIRNCRAFWAAKAREMPNLKKVICFGGTALTSVLDQAPGRLDKWRQQPIHTPEFPNWTFFVTYHPAYTLGHRNPQAEKYVLEDLIFAMQWDLAASKIQEPTKAGTSVGEETERRLWAFSDPKTTRLKTRPWWILDVCRNYVVWDLEHTVPPKEGKVPENMSPWPDCLGRVGELKYLCWSTRFAAGGQRLQYERLEPHFISQIEAEFMTNIIFHAQHDIPWLYVNYGQMPQGPIFDPMIGYHLLDENYPDKSLEGICKRVFKAEPWKKAFWDNFSWEDPDWKALHEYCRTDVRWTQRLALYVAQQISREGLERLFVHEMANLQTSIEGICLGTAYDIEEAEAKRASLLLEAEVLHERARQLVGRELNLNSPQQILPVLKLFNKRVRDTSTPTLRRWLYREPGFEFGRLVLEFRRLQSELRYLVNYKNRLKADGKFHPTFGRTETGRHTCSGPNLMNVMR